MNAKSEVARKWGPAGRLVWAALAVAVGLGIAPHLGAFLGAGVVAIAGLDVGLDWGRRERVWVAGEDGAEVRLLRLSVGRSLRLRLGIKGETPSSVVLMAAEARLDQGIAYPMGEVGIGEAFEILGLARGRYRGLRCGWERRSRLGWWRVRQWQRLDCQFAVYPDLTAGRRALMQSPVHRALAASRQRPFTGHGREFERLRDYQSGDNYSDLSWKATARRRYPVTRLFQWEQAQEVYFVMDHSRLSRHHLDSLIETALVGAGAAQELGDRHGLITFADGITDWIGAGSGRAHFQICRERLLDLQGCRATPDFEQLFSTIARRLRRRCYLLYLGNLTERGVAAAFLSAARLVRRTHLVLANSMLPDEEPRPAASGIEQQYRKLASAREQRRIAALRPGMEGAGVQFRAVPSTWFLCTAIEGYWENKRGQRL